MADALEVPEYAIAIIHGDTHKMRQLCVVVNNEEEFDAFTEGLEQFLVTYNPEMYTSDRATLR